MRKTPPPNDEPAAEGPRAADWQRDHALVRAAVGGDRAAREEIARRMECIPLFLADVHRARGSPLPPAELEERARDVVLAVLKRLDSFEGRSRFETWIYRFCELTISNAIRKRAPRTVDLDTTREPFERTTEALPFEDAARVREAVRELGGLESAVLAGRYFAGLRVEEIAAELAVSIHAVKRAHVRGLQRLSIRLGKAFGPDGP